MYNAAGGTIEDLVKELGFMIRVDREIPDGGTDRPAQQTPIQRNHGYTPSVCDANQSRRLIRHRA